MINENFSNIKLTSARKSILDILINSSKPLSYEDIKDKISMDKATFYRNITIFEEGNIINSTNTIFILCFFASSTN